MIEMKNIDNKDAVSHSPLLVGSTVRNKRKPLPLYKRWIVNKRGKRTFGNKEAVQRRLNCSVREMLVHLSGERNFLNDIRAEFWAKHAAHWALALKGR